MTGGTRCPMAAGVGRSRAGGSPGLGRGSPPTPVRPARTRSCPAPSSGLGSPHPPASPPAHSPSRRVLSPPAGAPFPVLTQALRVTLIRPLQEALATVLNGIRGPRPLAMSCPAEGPGGGGPEFLAGVPGIQASPPVLSFLPLPYSMKTAELGTRSPQHAHTHTCTHMHAHTLISRRDRSEGPGPLARSADEGRGLWAPGGHRQEGTLYTSCRGAWEPHSGKGQGHRQRAPRQSPRRPHKGAAAAMESWAPPPPRHRCRKRDWTFAQGLLCPFKGVPFGSQDVGMVQGHRQGPRGPSPHLGHSPSRGQSLIVAA